MATIKSYTDIEQSKKLADILPIETADMCYLPTHIGDEHHFIASLSPYSMCIKMTDVSSEYCTPCWSLAALLNVVSTYCNRLEITLRTNKKYNVFAVKDDFVFRSFDEFLDAIDNLIDCCYEMVIRLHKLNLL